MTRAERLLERVLLGTSDADIPFAGIRQLLEALGFPERIRGSHHIFTRKGVEEILNLQPRRMKGQVVSGQTGPRRDTEVQAGRGEPVIRYEVIIYWSRDDRAFVAEVPELPGCAADGKTYQEALSNAETVIREWIETARDVGREVPEPKGRLLFA